MQSDRTLMLAMPALLLGVGLTVGLFVWPNYRDARSCEVEVATLLTKIETLEVQARQLDQLQDELAGDHHRIDHELKVIPESADLAMLMRKLSQEVDRVTVIDQTFTAGSATEAIAAKQDSTTSSVNGGSTPGSSKSEAWAAVQAMPLTVDMESTFDAVLALIRNAETLDRLVRITNVRLTCKRDAAAGVKPPSSEFEATGSAEGSPILKASVGMEVIFQPSGAASKPENTGPSVQSTAAHSKSNGEGH